MGFLMFEARSSYQKIILLRIQGILIKLNVSFASATLFRLLVSLYENLCRRYLKSYIKVSNSSSDVYYNAMVK